jgi:hypothetical protein
MNLARAQLAPFASEPVVQALDVRMDRYRKQRGAANDRGLRPDSAEEAV